MKFFNNSTRRDFLKFMGQGAALISLSNLSSSCTFIRKNRGPFKALNPSSDDALLLAEGFKYNILIQQGDSINLRGESFGSDCDFTCFIPMYVGSTDDGLLWVNHESFQPVLLGHSGSKTKEMVMKEQREVGGSILRIKKSSQTGEWYFVEDDSFNRRLDATTPIKFANGVSIKGSQQAIGTLANCAGGLTPWGTVLTCEENFQNFYGDSPSSRQKSPPSGWSSVFSKMGKRWVGESDHSWYEFFDYPPEHYGWVVEVNPKIRTAQKLTALGRFAHEGATSVLADDGRCVVYMGDDSPDQCIYKFISSTQGSLINGTLYVAQIETGQWIALDYSKNSTLKENFESQLEVLIRAREAAHLVGGTPLNRPEDIEVHPQTRDVIISLTNNKKRDDPFGSLLKISEENADPLSLRFKASALVKGGESSGFACPDNLVFDRKGNLWITCDISGLSMNQPPYEKFKNNGLFYIPLSGESAGSAFQVASAPRDAELTGPWFSPDGRSLFLSVQHPGETSKSIERPTSHWPNGGSNLPRSSVVVIQGDTLDRLVL